MIHGYLEMATPNLIQGWAFDDEVPTVRLVVRAHLGDTELAQAEASSSRPDLQRKWGDNDGNHGFIVEMAAPLSVQGVADIIVRVARPGTAVWHRLPRYVGSETVIKDAVAAITEAVTASLQNAVRRLGQVVKTAAEDAERAQNVGNAMPSSDVAFKLASVIEAHFGAKNLSFPPAIAADFHLGRYSDRRFDAPGRRAAQERDGLHAQKFLQRR
jgi:hypothetical protein